MYRGCRGQSINKTVYLSFLNLFDHDATPGGTASLGVKPARSCISSASCAATTTSSSALFAASSTFSALTLANSCRTSVIGIAPCAVEQVDDSTSPAPSFTRSWLAIAGFAVVGSHHRPRLGAPTSSADPPVHCTSMRFDFTRDGCGAAAKPRGGGGWPWFSISVMLPTMATRAVYHRK